MAATSAVSTSIYGVITHGAKKSRKKPSFMQSVELPASFGDRACPSSLPCTSARISHQGQQLGNNCSLNTRTILRRKSRALLPKAAGNCRHHSISAISTPPKSSSSPSSTSTPSTSSLASSKSPSPELMEELRQFLYQDLPHLFGNQGIDRSKYDDKVEFRDPITKYDSIGGYLFNIQMLRFLFQPDFELHSVKQTAEDELTTRWTMKMKFGLLPWRPVIVFTGTSVMAVNPDTGKFRSHVDYWDSIEDNQYFSQEGLLDLIRQSLKIYKMPDLETPKYRVLQRTPAFEVRLYEPYCVVEGPMAEGEGVTGSKGFGTVAGYIQGKNERGQRMQMTTPVYMDSQLPVAEEGGEGREIVMAQLVLPLSSSRDSLPAPSDSQVSVREVPSRVLAAVDFNGNPTPERVSEVEGQLRKVLIRAGLQPLPGYALARYNDPRTFGPIKRNDVLIELKDYTFESVLFNLSQ